MAKLNMNSVDVTNAIRNAIVSGGDTEYENRIPEATKYNMAQIGEIFKVNDNLANKFLSALVNRIAFPIVKSRLYKNPLSEFKRGELGMGTTIEEIFVQVAEAHHYNPAVAEKEVFKREIPDVRAYFHVLNRQDFYKVTIENNDLYNAFLTENGVTDMIGRIVDSLYSGDNYDEFLLMKNLISQYIDKYRTYDVQVNAITDEASAKEFLILVRGLTNNMRFMSNKYNSAGVTTFTDMSDILIFVTPETQARLDVDALAVLFNMSKGEIQSRVVVIDTFGQSPRAQSTLAFITDKDFYMVYDKLFKFTEQYNGQGLYWNYFLHHWELMSASRFSPAIRLTTEDVANTGITSISVTPETAEITLGQNQQFIATIEGTGNYLRGANWTTTGKYSEISSTGLLQVNPAETDTTLTITATAEGDPTKSATATVTVKPFFS